MLAADFRMCFLCCSFFLIYNIIIVIILCLSVLCNSVKHILEFNYYFQEEEGQFFHYYQNCYSNRCVQNADCRLYAGSVGLSFLDQLIFLHS